jgi:hypothetical protein
MKSNVNKYLIFHQSTKTGTSENRGINSIPVVNKLLIWSYRHKAPKSSNQNVSLIRPYDHRTF